MKKKIAAFLVLWIVWVLVAGFDPADVILGGVVALILSFIVSRHVNYVFGFSIVLTLLKFVFVYIPVFIYKLVLANLDMAYRVLSPRLPINPKIVKVPTALTGDFAKLVLANSITLTPGTLSLDVEENGVLVHWVNAKGDSPEEYKKNISQSFENLLGGKTK